MKHTARVASGTLTGLVAGAEWIPELTRCAEQPGPAAIEICEFQKTRFVLKRSALRGSAARRHAVRGLFGLKAPRLAEFQNLAWLRTRLFHAPRPLFAGVVTKFGLPGVQFLATEFLPESKTLGEFLAEAAPRGAVLATLAREVARLHSLGFVHRDLYPRNLLVRGTSIAFLDAWRGGAGIHSRGPTYDLACLMLYGADWLTQSEQERFFSDYLRERAGQDRPVSAPQQFAARIERDRARLRERLARRPHERRGRELPSAQWRVPLGG